MFQVLLADDEKMTRELLLQEIPWSALRFEICAVAENGQEAAELAQRCLPDLAILDVRMPKCSGIEAAEKIRAALPDCCILFLSGYTDKAYLKSAIKLQAVDYIEKPIDLKELQAVLRRIAALCSARQASKTRDLAIRERATLGGTVLKRSFVVELVQSGITEERLQKANAAGIRLKAGDPCRVLLFRLNLHLLPEGVMPSRRDILEALQDVTGSAFDGLYQFLDHTHIVFIASGKRILTGELDARIREIRGYFMEKTGVRDCVSAAIGISSTLETLPESFASAQQGMRRAFFTGYASVLSPSRLEQQPLPLAADAYFDRLRAFAERGDGDAVSAELRAMEGELGRLDSRVYSESARAFLAAHLTRLLQWVSEFQIPIYDEWVAQQKGWADVLDIGTMPEYFALLQRKFATLCACKRENEGKSAKIKDTIYFIRRHYAEDLSLSRLAELAGMNQTYLSSLFRKECGMPLSKYIEEVRIEQACKLLRGTDKKLSEIAELSGYRNATYFATVFKNAKGMYPSQYRRN